MSSGGAASLEALRHTRTAGNLRRWIYGAFVGGPWPLAFRAPRGELPEGPAGSLYVHIPFCRSLCGHCPYLKVPFDPALAEAYGAALAGEMAAWLARTPPEPLRHVYFGGGSPGMVPALAARCLAVLAPRLEGSPAIGMELHPLDVGGSLLADLRALGVDRVSLGIESLSDAALRGLGRGYTARQALDALDRTLAAGFRCVDVNLMYGLGPEDSLLEDARRCLERGADQISAYPLIAFRHTRPAWIPRIRALRTRDRLQRDLRDLCGAQGLAPASVWSFARPGAPPYTTVTLETYRGFGAGAATRTRDAFWFHTFDVRAYVAPGGTRPALALDGGERFLRAHWLYWKIYALRVPGAPYRASFGRAPEADFPRLFGWLARLGIAVRDGEDWVITPRGADWVHRVQQLYSLSWIDQFWGACMAEAWPAEVRLT